MACRRPIRAAFQKTSWKDSRVCITETASCHVDVVRQSGALMTMRIRSAVALLERRCYIGDGGGDDRPGLAGGSKEDEMGVPSAMRCSQVVVISR